MEILGATMAAGLIVIGAASSIGKISASATESMARQPENSDKVMSAMVIAAALVEGLALFAVLVCLLVVLK